MMIRGVFVHVNLSFFAHAAFALVISPANSQCLTDQ
jgi:hypothetical protein